LIRIEAANPLPAGRTVRVADALRNHADPDVAIVDQPGLLLGLGIAAAGELGHRYRPLPLRRQKEPLAVKPCGQLPLR
jgi:hypothetical protein